MQVMFNRAALLFLIILFSCSALLPAQTSQESQPFLRDYSEGPSWFPLVTRPYEPQVVPPMLLENSTRLGSLIHDGQLELSLADAMALALENSLDIAVQRYVKPLAETDLLRTRAGQGLVSGAGAGGGGGGAISVAPSGSFDPAVNVNFSWDRVSSPLNNIVVEGTPISISYATALSTNYSQLFPTGTNYSFSVTGLRRSSNTRQLFNPSVSSGFSLGVNQPLLSGFGKLPYMRNILVAQNNRRLSEETFRLQVVNTVVQVENMYWDLATFQENVRVAEQSRDVSRRLLEDNRKQAEIGTLAPLDVVAAEAEVAGRERDLILAQTNLQLQESRLKTVLSKRVDPDLDAARIVITTRMPEPREPDIPLVQDALANALNNRPDLVQQEGTLQNQNITQRFATRNLLPSGSVFGLLGGSGLRGNGCSVEIRPGELCPENQLIVGGAADSLRQTFGLDFPEYGAGLSVSLPIRNRAAQADQLRSQLEGHQLQVSLQRTQNQIALEVRQAIIGLVQGKAQVEAAHEAVRLAQETFDAEQKKLQAGVSTPYQVVLRQRDLLAAQTAEVQSVSNYSKALVEMDRAMGTTLDRNGIVLSDALSGTITRMPTPRLSVIGFPPAGEGSR